MYFLTLQTISLFDIVIHIKQIYSRFTVRSDSTFESGTVVCRLSNLNLCKLCVLVRVIVAQPGISAQRDPAFYTDTHKNPAVKIRAEPQTCKPCLTMMGMAFNANDTFRIYLGSLLSRSLPDILTFCQQNHNEFNQ